MLSFEHRTAASAEPIAVRLAARADGSAVHLATNAGNYGHERAEVAAAASAPGTLARKALAAPGAAAVPIPRGVLRDQLRVNIHRLGDALTELGHRQQGRRNADGWTLAMPARMTTGAFRAPFRLHPMGARNGTPERHRRAIERATRPGGGRATQHGALRDAHTDAEFSANAEIPA